MTNPANNSNNHISAQSRNQSQGANTTNAGGNLRQRTLDSFPKKARPETHRLVPNNNASGRPTVQQQLPRASNNPYQRSGNNSGQSSQLDNRAQPQQHQHHQQQQQPPIQNSSNVIPIDVDDSPPQQQQPQQVQSNPYSSLRPSATQSNSSTTAGQAVAASSSATASTPSSFTSNPSFTELKSIMQSLRSNRALYEQYHGKTITVPSKIFNTNDNVFNIVKQKGKSKKEKKYEFLLVSKFLGTRQSDGAIACRVESSVLEPYFDGYGPVSEKFSCSFSYFATAF